MRHPRPGGDRRYAGKGGGIMRRSMLFLPGNNPNMLINGNCLGSDAVIFDLEDAVSPAEKDAARILVRNTMRYMDFPRPAAGSDLP